MPQFDAHTNFANSTVAVAPNPATSGTTLTLAAGDGVKFTGVPPYNCTVVCPGGTEIIRVIAIAEDSVTFLRGQEGTSPVAITSGSLIVNSNTAKTLTDIEGLLIPSGNLNGGSTPTKWRFTGTFGQPGFALQKQDPGSTTWSNFLIRGINFNPTPVGFNPNSGMQYDALSNLQQVKWFAQNFGSRATGGIGGNTVRIYYSYQAQSGTNGVMNGADDILWRKALDIFYQYGIYVIIDLYVNFYSFYNTTTLTAWYQQNQATGMMEIVQHFADHPAVMGYLFGNETNASGNLQSTGMTLAKWWTYANTVAGEVKSQDTNHIMGISSAFSNSTDISNILAAENGGLLNNFDYHGNNIYRGASWNLPIEGTTPFFGQYNPTNGKPVIITETGVDAYNNTAGALDTTTQASAAVALWSTFDQTKCPGLIYYEATDEWWKTGNGGGTTGGNDGTTQGTSGFVANSDSFYMPNDQFSNEQYFGWWTTLPATPFTTPPTARAIVSTMNSTW